MPVLDTSLLVALLNADDPLHGKARGDVAGLRGASIPYPVLVELVQVVEYRVRQRLGAPAGRRAAREAFVAIDGSASFAVELPRGLPEAARLFLADKRLSLVDAVGVAHAIEAEEDLMTYDKHQARAFRNARR